jgi:hypothetical protein
MKVQNKVIVVTGAAAAWAANWHLAYLQRKNHAVALKST